MNEDGLELVVERRLRDRFRDDAGSVDTEPAVRAVMQRVRGQRQDAAQRGVVVRIVAGVVAVALTFVIGTAILATRPVEGPAAPAPPAPHLASDGARPSPCESEPANTPRPSLDPAGPMPSASFELYTHCGLDRSLILFDGSYWKALAEPSGPLDDPFDQGTMTLLGPDRAEYVSHSGATVILERLSARPSFVPCR